MRPKELTPEQRAKRGIGELAEDIRQPEVRDADPSPRRSISDAEVGIDKIREKGIGGYGAAEEAKAEHRSDIPLTEHPPSEPAEE